MRVTMDAHENDYADTVLDSWAMIQERYIDEAFGNIFYAEMQRTAPDLLTLFVRPKALQYLTFVKLMETLVQFAQDPEVFYQMVGVISAAAFLCANSTRPVARQSYAESGHMACCTLCDADLHNSVHHYTMQGDRSTGNQASG
jgi:hypothetical protein